MCTHRPYTLVGLAYATFLVLPVAFPPSCIRKTVRSLCSPTLSASALGHPRVLSSDPALPLGPSTISFLFVRCLLACPEGVPSAPHTPSHDSFCPLSSRRLFYPGEAISRKGRKSLLRTYYCYPHLTDETRERPGEIIQGLRLVSGEGRSWKIALLLLLLPGSQLAPEPFCSRLVPGEDVYH